MRNLKIILEYDGAAYGGWQSQKGGGTIQQTVESCLKEVTREEIRITAAGRTDAGVHAFHQVANFLVAKDIHIEQLRRAMNAILPPDIAIKSIEEVCPSFHARFDALSKIYLYRIMNRPIKGAIGRQYQWYLPRKLNMDAMEQALSFFPGTQDFSAFCGAGSLVRDRTRTVVDGGMKIHADGLIEIRIEADGFLRHMVRNIVGTLVEVGLGRIAASDIPAIIAGRDRRRAGKTAPACGLFLLEVRY